MSYGFVFQKAAQQADEADGRLRRPSLIGMALELRLKCNVEGTEEDTHATTT